MILREANLADCKVFFEWVNDDSVRQSAIKKDLIEWKSHKEWFVKKLNCKTSYLLLKRTKLKLAKFVLTVSIQLQRLIILFPVITEEMVMEKQ